MLRISDITLPVVNCIAHQLNFDLIVKMPSPIDDISAKISISKLGTESKDIFLLLLSYFDRILNEKDSRVTELETKVSTLESKIEKLENEVDQNNQYDRLDTLIISGEKVPKEAVDENCKTIVTNLFRDHLHLNVNPNDISVVHRIGKTNGTNSTVKRNIIMKLCRRDLASEIYSACRQFRPKFFVNDSLTPLRSKISYMLRQLRNKYPSKIKSCKSLRGEPVAYVVVGGRDRVTTRQTSAGASTSGEGTTRRCTITTRLQLEEFARDHLQTTLTEASLSW